MKTKEVLMVLGLMFTVGAVVFGNSIYWFGAMLDRNLAYMGLYYDDVSVDLFKANASDDAILLTSEMAWRYCELYRIERRTIENRFADLCEAIQERNVLYAICLDDPLGDICTGEKIANLQAKLDAVGYLGKDLMESPPYFGIVFSDTYMPMSCYLGGEAVPCPGEI